MLTLSAAGQDTLHYTGHGSHTKHRNLLSGQLAFKHQPANGIQMPKDGAAAQASPSSVRDTYPSYPLEESHGCQVPPLPQSRDQQWNRGQSSRGALAFVLSLPSLSSECLCQIHSVQPLLLNILTARIPTTPFRMWSYIQLSLNNNRAPAL